MIVCAHLPSKLTVLLKIVKKKKNRERGYVLSGPCQAEGILVKNMLSGQALGPETKSIFPVCLCVSALSMWRSEVSFQESSSTSTMKVVGTELGIRV